jgi:hypothetical protein
MNLRRLLPLLFVFAILFTALPSLAAQEEEQSDLLDQDVDSLFGGGSEDSSDEGASGETEESDEDGASSDSGDSETAEESDVQDKKKDEGKEDGEKESGGADLLAEVEKKPGFKITAKYNFKAGYSMDWNFRPWERDYVSDPGIDHTAGADLDSSFSLDYQISPELRVRQRFALGFPDYDLDVKAFYADYSISKSVFFSLGKKGVSWGRSPNYPFANIVNRTPPGTSGGDTYVLSMNVPIGIGGIETLALARAGLIDDLDSPEISEIGVGGKYNLAVPAVDLNVGTFFHKDMKLRGFYSLKTTLFDRLEVYQEGMLGFDQYRDYSGMTAEEVLAFLDASANIGFYDDYFGDRLQVNGEYFYNGEGAGNAFDLDEDLEEELANEPSPFIKGHNMALTFTYKPGFWGSRFYLRYKHNFNEQSGYLSTGARFKPLPDMTISLGAPLVTGLPGGSYYTDNTSDLFRIALGVTIGGSYTHRGGK